MYAIAQSLLEILTQQLGFEGDFTHSLTEEDAIEAFVMASLEGDIQHVRENLYLLNSKDKRGNSALGSAAINNKLEVLKILCSQGSSCQIDIEDNDGCTPLMLAASAGHEECASLLIESGAKIRRKDKNGWTPLHHACAGGCVRVMKTLVELGVDVSQETAFEETCLFLAAYAGNVESVKFLLNIGADPTYVNSKGEKASDFTEVPEIHELLLKTERACSDEKKEFRITAVEPAEHDALLEK